MRVCRWGNSLAIRLPSPVIEALGIAAGDEIEVEIAGSRRLEIAAKPDRDALLERLRQYRGAMPADFKFDRLEANAR
jgi:antitoxin MazE